MPINISDIESEIEAGFSGKVAGPQNERDRLKRAWDNLRFSQAQFDEYPTRYPDDNYDRTDAYRRTTPIFRRIMEVLTGNLYRTSPTRQLADANASQRLAKLYERNAMGPKWQRADQLTVVGDFAAFQFSGGEDPDFPVEVQLWGAHEMAVWCDPDRPTDPVAVAVIDAFDRQRRCRLWTGEEKVTYVTSKGDDRPGSGGTAFKEIDRIDNPYRTKDGQGILPFSFAHWEFPTQDFYSGGIGDGLRELNDHANFRLDNSGDCIRYIGRPIAVAEGVNEGWSPPALVRPGEWLSLPGAGVDAAGHEMGPPPNLRYVSPDHSWVKADWDDYNGWLDHELEMYGIPPATIRMVQSGARSGFSILVEQAPLLAWVERRRGPFAAYELNAVKKAFEVGGAWMRANGRDTAGFDALAVDPRLTLRWPKLYVQLPGPERDTADDWRVARGYASKLQVFMEREGCSREEAIEHFAQVAKDNEQLEQLGIDPTVPQPGQQTPLDETDQTDEETGANDKGAGDQGGQGNDGED